MQVDQLSDATPEASVGSYSLQSKQIRDQLPEFDLRQIARKQEGVRVRLHCQRLLDDSEHPVDANSGVLRERQRNRLGERLQLLRPNTSVPWKD
jgi:hypothetical protein